MVAVSPCKLCVLASSLFLLLVNSTAHATTCSEYGPTGTELCLEDGNAIFVVDPVNGVQVMDVDGNEHIFFQDFLIDDLNASGQGLEYGMDSYPTLQSTVPASPTNTVSLQYDQANPINSPTIQLDFALTGGAIGSDTATIEETFTITNDTGGTLDLHLFAYTDVDLGGPLDSGDDEGELLSTTSYRQFDDTYQLLASTDVAVDAYQVGIANVVLDELYDSTDTIFPSTPGIGGSVGPGDLQMVAQWIVTLADTESFSYTQTLAISPVTVVPVPAAVWLFGSGLLGLVGIARRKRTV